VTGAVVAPKRKKRGIASAIVTLLLALVAAAGAVLFILSRQTNDPWGIHRRAAHAEVFDRVWLVVSQNYFDSTFGGIDWPAMKERYRPLALKAGDTQRLYSQSIWPMLSEIDSSHLSADAPDKNASDGYSIHLRGRRGESMSEMTGGGGDLGGLTVVHDGKQWTVYGVRRGSTPEKLGIAPGRILLRSSATEIKGEASSRMKAELVFARPGGGEETISYEFPFRSVGHHRRIEKLSSGYTLIRFDIFDEPSIDWVIERLKEAGPSGAILDLRYNRGGNIGELQRIAGALLPNSAPIGRTVGRMLTLPVFAPVDGIQYKAPLAVLIGPQTASAGEMLADALRLNKRAVLVGDRTAGAVLTSRFWKLPDGGWLTVPTGNFTTADGRRLEAVGVEPDVPAVETLAAIRENRDLVVEAAEKSFDTGTSEDEELTAILPDVP
jgi:carboxyl-terminal processing protease